MDAEHLAAKAALRERALRTLVTLVDGDTACLARVRERLDKLVVLRRPGWKDANPRSLVVALYKDMGITAHELQQRVHVVDWTALCNWSDWYQDEVIALLDSAEAGVSR